MRGRPTCHLDHRPRRPPDKWPMASVLAAERQRITLPIIEKAGLEIIALTPGTAHAARIAAEWSPKRLLVYT